MTTIVETSQQQPYTILRIKRKRNEEPLDGLVIESAARRKKSRVFQFAQTVEDAAWADEEVKAQIQAEVSRLSSVPLTSEITKLPVKTRRPSNLRRYTVIEQEKHSEQEALPQPKTAPASVPEPTAKFTMLDAVPEGPSEMDSEMEKIMPMLQAYLSLHEPTLPQQELDTDYVWDLYHLSHPTSSDWNSAATVGTLTGLPPSLNDPDSSDSDSEVEDEADEDSNAEEYFANDYPDEEESSDFESDSNSSGPSLPVLSSITFQKSLVFYRRISREQLRPLQFG